jgi:hypothetical protein
MLRDPAQEPHRAVLVDRIGAFVPYPPDVDEPCLDEPSENIADIPLGKSRFVRYGRTVEWLPEASEKDPDHLRAAPCAEQEAKSEAKVDWRLRVR